MKKKTLILLLTVIITVLATATSMYASDIRIGDYIEFGNYEQDNDYSNGSETIEWLVLDKQGSNVLVISEYALAVKPYYTEYVDVTWETCDLRGWLNGEFYNEAFSEAERKQIEDTMVSAEDNEEYGTDAGNDTRDKVFLLSISEAISLFANDEARICYPTDALAHRAYLGQNGACAWWLRSPGLDSNYAAFVFIGGTVYSFGFYVDHAGLSVRPALWINLES